LTLDGELNGSLSGSARSTVVQTHYGQRSIIAMNSKRTFSFLISGVVLLCLVIVTGYAYFYGYQALQARGWGERENLLALQAPLSATLCYLSGALIVGFVTFELTRPHLPNAWRFCYVATLGLGVALFIVKGVVQQYALPNTINHPAGCSCPTCVLARHHAI
jgi:hypothetical protein